MDDVRRDVAGVLSRFRQGRAKAFSFGEAGVPEALLLTYDEFEDLGGETKLARRAGVVTAETVRVELSSMVATIRVGEFAPVVWGEGDQPEAVIMSTSQHRELRGDDEPPAGTIDDPTRRAYATEPLPSSRPMSIDELAALMGPEAVDDLEELRRADGEIP